ncbi:hypothetical protein GALMADRAFT_133852 [Galerina marginata CBS 339.88]|uniref:Uncharacterized protein n=1 Tax=Galerina marginata (strain CBS 339.88) TaxID=685588 RepID=A0A067TN54_GALM3|nr:hypothetical protein GALMADRAFT_133852 [Galerina marginata CBS 339.88]
MGPVPLVLALFIGAEADDGSELDADKSRILSNSYCAWTRPPSTTPQCPATSKLHAHASRLLALHRLHHLNDAILAISPLPLPTHAGVDDEGRTHESGLTANPTPEHTTSPLQFRPRSWFKLQASGFDLDDCASRLSTQHSAPSLFYVNINANSRRVRAYTEGIDETWEDVDADSGPVLLFWRWRWFSSFREKAGVALESDWGKAMKEIWM